MFAFVLLGMETDALIVFLGLVRLETWRLILQRPSSHLNILFLHKEAEVKPQ